MDNALGLRIKALRERRRWTQQDVADLLGVSTKSVSNWENGKNDPRASIGALEELFGVDLSTDSQPVDPVEAAVRASDLVEWRQDRVLSEYKRQVYEQQAAAAG